MLSKIYLAAVCIAFVSVSGDDTFAENMKKGIETIGVGIGDKMSESKKYIEHQAENAKEHIIDAKDSMKETAGNIKDGVEHQMDDGGTFLENLGKKIKDAADSVGESFSDATQYIGKKIGVIKPTKTEEAAKTIDDAIKGTFGRINAESEPFMHPRFMRQTQ